MNEHHTQAVAVAHPAPLTELACKPQEVLRAAALIQEVMSAVMRDGEHYGVIPGTQGKKSLFKSGAEKLSFVFGLSNKLDIKTENLPGGHREYTITCELFDRAGNMRGQGVGSASTMESKHRYRGAAGKACPKCGAMACKPSKKEFGGGYFCDQKGGGCGWSTKAGSAEAKALDQIPAVRQENMDPADQFNTVLKMAKKRALVDAVLTATAASDCFAQDLEDLEGEIDAADARDAAKVHPAQAQPARTAESVATAPTQTTQQQPPQHPALVAANALWLSIQQQRQGAGTPIMTRLAKLNGAEKAKDIAPDQMDRFEKDVAALSKLLPDVDKIDATLTEWENAQKEGN